MKKLLIATLSTGLLISANVQAEAPATPAKVAMCVGCHGANGNSVVPNFPKLAGQHASYLEKQLKDFRDGFRKDATMAAFAKGLTDAEVKELAAYYAAQ
ncbi:cytochrome c [Thiomicrorhabdus sp. Milos-T2]|uniref:c-type cytochrome n=1 Tax=Thiomicrorhabdus sp. Milos-T2 TaxID=90814 RepID=UPI00049455E5|nr:cytochrome c [Thiomicrorhabdus sp. Milos-T2]